MLLPGLTGGIAFVVIPCIVVVQKQLGDAGQGDDVTLKIILATALMLPLVLSNVSPPTMAQFDQLQPVGELPVYITVRPMTNGGFVMAKLAMALVSSALTWLIVVAAACLWLALLEKEPLFSKAGSITIFRLGAFVIGCVPLLLLLIIWTWKNLVTGIGAGLTGRNWIGATFIFWRLTSFIGLVALIFKAKNDGDFRETLLHWLPWFLTANVATKVAVSVAAFNLGLRRNAITGKAVGWIVGGWSACGLFVAGYAGLVCNIMHKPELWIWVALAGFLILPLADLAIAPLALAWNRHR